MAPTPRGALLFMFMLFAGAARSSKASNFRARNGPAHQTGNHTSDAGPDIASATKDVFAGGANPQPLGRIRYHYRRGTRRGRRCADVVVMGVGTAMGVGDYDGLGRRVAAAAPGLVFVAADYHPGGLVKTSAAGYAALFDAVRARAGELVPACAGRAGAAAATPRLFHVGGHSAGGQAALVAAQDGLYDGRRPAPAGFVGLDPYDASADTLRADVPLPFPTLDWGFTRTTCLVNVAKAAAGAYHFSSADEGRVLYAVDNAAAAPGAPPRVEHCVFTDDGCGIGPVVVCPAAADRAAREALFDAVAGSLRLFLGAVRERREAGGEDGAAFSRRRFEPPAARYREAGAGNDIFLYVNDDVVEGEEKKDGSAASSQ